MSMTGNMELAKNNPFRYRGYYYDEESGLYYLNSRYYDPQTGRFINADAPEILDGGNDHLLENNLFAYCFNDPVNNSDPNGYFALALAGFGAANFWNPIGWVALGVSAVATAGVIAYGIYEMSKGGKQRIRDTGYLGIPDQEINRRYNDPKTPKAERQRLKKEQKARRSRNMQKRGGNNRK